MPYIYAKTKSWVNGKTASWKIIQYESPNLNNRERIEQKKKKKRSVSMSWVVEQKI
jgi:hypothetical protein